MGYRSDVAYIIEFDSFEDRDTYANLKLALAPDDPEHRAILECDYERTDRPVITFRATDVKWYPGYSEVIAHTHIYQGVRDVFEKARWRFVGLGEDGQSECNDDDPDEDLYDDLHIVNYVATTF
jgi:hypothetical protein